MIDRIYDNTGAPDSDATGGSTTRAFDGPNVVETFGGLRIIVSDDIPTTGSVLPLSIQHSSLHKGQLLQVSKHQSEHKQIETFLLLRKQWQWIFTTSITLVGLKYAVSTVNPSRRTVLETVGSWSKVYETKNIRIVRATNVSNQD